MCARTKHFALRWNLYYWQLAANRKDWSTCYENDESIRTKRITWMEFPCRQLRTLAWHLVATFSLKARDMVTPPVIFGIASDGYPSDTTGTMKQSNFRVTGKLQSYGDSNRVQDTQSRIKSWKTLRGTMKNIAKYDDITKTQPQLWEQFKQPETLLPELRGQVQATWADSRP
jgi:hypothetical protein